jgi:hypothetical protein
MDPLRKIRFIIAPFFFYAVLAFVLYWSSHGDNIFSESPDPKLLAAVLSAIIISILPLGFLIGTISITFLRLIFYPLSGCDYELSISTDPVKRRDFMRRIWTEISFTSPMYTMDQSQLDHIFFSSGITFDHESIRKKREGVHEWLIRRWSAFNINCHCIVAIILANIFIFPLDSKSTYSRMVDSNKFNSHCIFTFQCTCCKTWMHGDD